MASRQSKRIETSADLRPKIWIPVDVITCQCDISALA